jgi:hypothetical protein
MGILNLLKNLVGSKTGTATNIYTDIIEKTKLECKTKGIYLWSFKPADSAVYKEHLLPLSDKEKIAFIVFAATSASDFYAKTKSYNTDDDNYQSANIANSLFRQLLKLKMQMDDEDILLLTNIFIHTNLYSFKNILNWPIGHFVTQLERAVKEKGLNDTKQQCLENIRKAVGEGEQHHEVKAQAKLIERIDAVLFASSNTTTLVKPVYFPGDDEFAGEANNTLKSLTGTEQQSWFKLMALAQKASGAKPTKKLLDESKTIFKELNTDKFKKIVTG